MDQIKEMEEQYKKDVDASCKKLSDDLHAICDEFIKNIVELNEIEKKKK